MVFVILDAMAQRWISPDLTPALSGLAQTGGMAPNGATAIMSSATYPNHAAFATGAGPEVHNFWTNRVKTPAGYLPAREIDLDTPTFLGVARAAGLDVSLVAGDASIVAAMGAYGIDRAWPPRGFIPAVDAPELAVDEYGYVTNDVVLGMIDATNALDADLAVIHFNDPDTACHVYGPDSTRAIERYRDVDQCVGSMLSRLSRDDGGAAWANTVLIVVSDHDQEEVDPHGGVDIASMLDESGFAGTRIEYEGTAAIIESGPSLEVLRALPGVDGGVEIDADRVMIWTEPGRIFTSRTDHGLRGAHGSPRTAVQVAIVGGGHPVVGTLARALESAPISGTDWAPTIAHLLGCELPTATGRNLLAAVEI